MIQNKLIFSSNNKLPVILQSESTECGLACLAMVACYYGYVTDLATLRSKHPISMRGVTLGQLTHIANQLKLSPRAIKIELEDLNQITTPAILHWDFNHFVVLKQIKKGYAVIHDPAQGTRSVSFNELSQHFTGVALELMPSYEFEQKQEKQKFQLNQLVGNMPGLGGLIIQILLLAGVLEVFTLVSPFFMQLVVDSAIVSEDRDLLSVLGIGFILLACLQVIVTALRSWVVMVLGVHLNLQLISHLFQHLLRLPMTFFEKRHLGDVASRFESLNVVQRTLTTSFIEAIVDGLMAITTLIMMMIYSWKLATIVFIVAMAYGMIRLILYKPLLQASEQQIVYAAKKQTNFLETVRGIQSIKLFNRQQYRTNLFLNLGVDQFNAGIRVQKLQILNKVLNGSLFGIENIAVIWIGALLVLEGGFSIGMLFAFVAYKQQFISRVINFIEKGIEFKMLGLHLQRIGDIALAEPEKESTDFFNKETGKDLTVQNVSFKYGESDPMILKNINLTIKAGESVAIIGASGSGKTTLIKLLLGLMEPVEGEIYLGDKPLSKISIEHYRNKVGSVMQEDQLFAGSIKDNICFFDPDADHHFIQTCAQMAAIDVEIQAMPMDYNTLIGDMGTVLSGGQKQRILLARALYKKPEILFLDEATSHLDSQNEQRVNGAIQQLALTRIIIAHRTDTIASVDRVIDLSQLNREKLSCPSMSAAIEAA